MSHFCILLALLHPAVAEENCVLLQKCSCTRFYVLGSRYVFRHGWGVLILIVSKCQWLSSVTCPCKLPQTTFDSTQTLAFVEHLVVPLDKFLKYHAKQHWFIQAWNTFSRETQWFLNNFLHSFQQKCFLFKQYLFCPQSGHIKVFFLQMTS